MIQEMLDAGMTEEQIVQFLIDEIGESEVDARFMVGLVTGTVVGDYIEIDKDGNEHRPPSPIVE